jgi:hypothetical protein
MKGIAAARKSKSGQVMWFLLSAGHSILIKKNIKIFKTPVILSQTESEALVILFLHTGGGKP